jgi:hypothetical protein
MQLNDNMLRKLILQEAAKFGKMKPADSVKAKETGPDELADSLEKHEDFTVKEHLQQARDLRLEEARLTRRLETVRRRRKSIIESLLKRV